MSKYIEFVKENFKFKVLNSSNTQWDSNNFWNLFIDSWEPFTLNWIKENSDVNKSFLDIGAWIGPTSLWASKFFKSVHAFEPDPIAYEHLAENLALNSSNVSCYNKAVNSNGQDIEIYSRGGLGSSMTSMYTGDVSAGVVNGFSIENAIGLDEFSLIKIDIEGGERLIIDSFCEIMSNNPINLIFSFHTPFYKDPENDFNYIVNKLNNVYSSFTLENGTLISIKDIKNGFSTVFCTK